MQYFINKKRLLEEEYFFNWYLSSRIFQYYVFFLLNNLSKTYNIMGVYNINY